MRPSMALAPASSSSLLCTDWLPTTIMSALYAPTIPNYILSHGTTVTFSPSTWSWHTLLSLPARRNWEKEFYALFWTILLNLLMEIFSAPQVPSPATCFLYHPMVGPAATFSTLCCNYLFTCSSFQCSENMRTGLVFIS